MGERQSKTPLFGDISCGDLDSFGAELGLRGGGEVLEIVDFWNAFWGDICDFHVQKEKPTRNDTPDTPQVI